MQIREAVPDDAEALIRLFERLYAETTFLLMEPGELAWNREDYARRIGETQKAESGVMYVAEDNHELAGVVFGNRGSARRTRHSLFLVLGVLRAHWHRGIGSSLLRSAEAWAKSKGLHRLELTVQQRNTRAAALYEKLGFEVEGTKRRSLFVDGRFIDEWQMSKLIGVPPGVAAEAHERAAPRASPTDRDGSSAQQSTPVLDVQQTIPILRIFDLAKARDFYVGFLGFRVDWEHRFEPAAPAYLQVSRGGCVLHLTEHYGDCCPGSTVFLCVSGLERFHREIASKGNAYQRPGIELAPWNARLMEVTDPFGNRLRFNEYLA